MVAAEDGQGRGGGSEELAAALKKNKAAGKKFEAMTPGARREYCQWIAEAK